MTDTGSVSQSSTLGLETSFANLPRATAYGFVNVFEGSRVTIRASFKKAGGLFKRSGTWHIENVSTGEKEQVAVKIGSGATEAEHVLELKKVPPEEANYRIRYKLEFKDQMIPGQAEFVVWPRSIDLEAKWAEDAKDGSYKKGDPAKNFSFKITQSGGGAVDTSPFTDETGWRKNHPLRLTGAFKVVAAGSWEIKTWDKGEQKGRDVKVQVARKPYEAKIYNLPDGTEDADGKRHKQWVNQPHLPVAYFGMHMLVRVGAKEDQHQEDLGQRLGSEGDPIHVKVEFHADNSKVKGRGVMRKDMTRLTPKTGTEDRVFEFTVPLGASGAPADFYVDLGPAGGDRVSIKVGTTATCDNDTVFAESWRRLGVGLLIPKKEIRQSCPSIIDDDKAELGAGLKSKLKAILDKLFIQLYFPGELCKTFGTDDFDEGPYVSIDAAEYANWVYNKDTSSWSKPALAGKLFVPSSNLLGKIREKVLSEGVYKNDTIDMRWCDFLASRETKKDYDATLGLNFIAATFENATSQTINATKFHVFKKDPIEADDSAGIRGVRWKVLKVKKQGAATWGDPVPGGPGGDRADWQVMGLNDDTARDRFVTFADSMKPTIKLPATAANDPGKFLTITQEEDDGTGTGTMVDVTYVTKILVEVLVLGVHFNVLGNAFGGYINMSTRATMGTDQGEAHVIVHEVGHNLGQTYLQNLGPGELHDTPPGSDNRGRKTAMPGLPFGKAVPDGPYFAGKGYAGAHCAAAIKKKVDAALPGDGKAADRKAVYDEPSWGSPSDPHKDYFNITAGEHCIMFATTSPTSPTAQEFCADCVANIKATDASNIRKDWRST